jgi:hypothetical protein
MSRVTNRQWVYEIMTAQIQDYKPDVLLNHAVNGFSNDFLRGIKPYVKLLVGEHVATRLPELVTGAFTILSYPRFLPLWTGFVQREFPPS